MLARAAAPCRSVRVAPRASAPVARPVAGGAAPRRSFASSPAAASRSSAQPVVRPVVPRAYFHAAPRSQALDVAPADQYLQSNFGIAGAALLLGAAAYILSDNAEAAEAAFTGNFGTDSERTFIAIKPDGVQRGLIGEIIQRFEKKGYKLVACKVVQPTETFAKQHYADLAARMCSRCCRRSHASLGPFFPGLVKYFSSGPVFAMVWEGKNVIVNGRKIIGATNPAQAEPGSIRGDLCIETGRNIVRAPRQSSAENLSSHRSTAQTRRMPPPTRSLFGSARRTYVLSLLPALPEVLMLRSLRTTSSPTLLGSARASEFACPGHAMR